MYSHDDLNYMPVVLVPNKHIASCIYVNVTEYCFTKGSIFTMNQCILPQSTPITIP